MWDGLLSWVEPTVTEQIVETLTIPFPCRKCRSLEWFQRRWWDEWENLNDWWFQILIYRWFSIATFDFRRGHLMFLTIEIIDETGWSPTFQPYLLGGHIDRQQSACVPDARCWSLIRLVERMRNGWIRHGGFQFMGVPSGYVKIAIENGHL
jgi:hypothetical protein